MTPRQYHALMGWREYCKPETWRHFFKVKR